jgi:hypothetical protein
MFTFYVDIASRVFQGQSLGMTRKQFEYIGDKFTPTNDFHC